MLARHLSHLKKRRLYARGQWESSLESDCADLAINYPTPANLLLYINVKHSLSGFDSDSLQRLDAMASLSPAIRSPAVQARILSLKLDVFGPDSLASFQLPGFKYLRRYPDLLAHFGAGSSYTREEISVVKLAKSFASRVQPFSALVTRAEWRRISVVGNSPTSIGKGLGRVIDAADAVIRFNNAVTDDRFSDDYGRKFTAWVISPSYPLTVDNLASNKIVITGNAPFSRPNRFWLQLAQMPNIHFYTFASENWYELVRSLRAPPSAGLLCLHALKTLSDEPIKLGVAGMGGSQSASTTNHYADKHKRSERHNWEMERIMMEELMVLHPLEHAG